jgi:hypothetical protein
MGQLTSLSARCRDTAAAYENQMNPFAAFHRRERQQRFAELNPADKLVLTSAAPTKPPAAVALATCSPSL